ncbi:MAG: group 1 truncated hemoglobin [Candidatus Melainabacteria bacterium HGW-Melainabacteria-1]|nr:MAG: group 1 truncated hemoglobin [Candidatus Melainabacteria bacterium HGW-Melainabacteria-1]
MESTVLSLYQKYGGQATVATLVDSFYTKVLADPRIKHFFSQTDMERQRRHQTAFISQVLGGPQDYKGLDMRKAHARLNLNESHFGAVAEHLQLTLSEAGVEPADLETIMAAVASLKPEVLNQ